MDWTALHRLLDIGSGCYAAAALIALGIVSARAAKNDGVLFRRLTIAWFCLAVPFTVNALGICEEVIDFLPILNLRDVTRHWMWLAKAGAGTAAWAFWSALSAQHPKGKR